MESQEHSYQLDSQKRLALGLFHFNPHWGAETLAVHRHCSEAIGPFLQVVEANPDWNVTFEISGSGLEFLFNNYPAQFRLLHRLIEREQIELISSLYTPSIWVAFPRRDLLYSIEKNQECLRRLGLPNTRIFFAQEAFFGEGVKSLGKYFDIAICKDDYLAHFYDIDFSNPCFLLGDLKLVVASNHLLSESADIIEHEPKLAAAFHLPNRYQKHIESADLLNKGKKFPARCGIWNNVDWHWYHCGDGNHFTTIHKPQDIASSFYDPTWKRWCEMILNRLIERGYRLSTIRQFAAILDYSKAQRLPPLIEGSWNPSASDGVCRWMGLQSNEWENDAGILAAVSRVRARLTFCEKGRNQVVTPNGSNPEAANSVSASTRGGMWNIRRIIGNAEKSAIDNLALLDPVWIGNGWRGRLWRKIEEVTRDPEISPTLPAGLLDKAWTHLLHAQISDCLGWYPSAQSVWYAFEQIRNVLMITDRALRPTDLVDLEADVIDDQQYRSNIPCDEAFVSASLFGCDGSIVFCSFSDMHQTIECQFESTASNCGVSFEYHMDELRYCPSGIEYELVTIPFQWIRKDTISLPLSNGLIEVLPGVFLIKQLSFIHLAAQVVKSEHVVKYALRGLPIGKSYTWRFHVLKGNADSAVAFANKLNSI
jgi:glycosyl hydrolase family 57